MMKNKLFAIGAFVLGSMVTHAASAQVYVEGSLGITSTAEEGFEDDSGYRLVLGYDFNESWGIQAGIAELGTFNVESSILSFLEQQVSFEVGFPVTVNSAGLEASGLELAVIGYLPINENLDFYGKFGLLNWDADFAVNVSGVGDLGDSLDSGSDIFFSLGMTYDLAEKVSLLFDYSGYTVFDGDISMFGAGLRINF